MRARPAPAAVRCDGITLLLGCCPCLTFGDALVVKNVPIAPREQQQQRNLRASATHRPVTRRSVVLYCAVRALQACERIAAAAAPVSGSALARRI